MSNSGPRIIRTPDQRLRVFVSSTLQEVVTERQAAREAITHLRLSPVMFELGARPHPPKDLYRAYLDQSDIFVGIYWQKYGWVAPDMDISGLEDEWRLSGDKPKLIYIKAPAPDREPRLKSLLDRIRNDDRVSYKPFTSPEELRDLIENDLALLLTERFEATFSVGVPAPPLADRPRHNLPNLLTRFIGREKEITDIKARLNTARLVTLTGSGGAGKTRLSLQLAEEQLAEFKDGVWLVELAPLADSAYIASTIASTFSLREVQGVPLINLVIDYLRGKQLLLILDNCEHLVEACAQLADQLLQDCPQLKIIASSREALGINGETVYRVPSLALPANESNVEALMACESAQLFAERATRAEPRFHVTKDNAAAITQICRRLDGIPLAIELAAARVKLLTPQQIAERLDDRFKLLTGGSRTALPRQQTLRALIDWSYHTLNETEQRALRRLAVFSGGWTIEAAEAVIGESEALDGLAGLVNKSLINIEEQAGASRYRFLETIRQFAMEKLLESGEAVESRNRHLDYILQSAGPAEPEVFRAQSIAWLDQMELEHDNLRAALDWSASNQIAKAIELALATGSFWRLRDYNIEAMAWCQTILARAESRADLAATRIELYVVLAWSAIFAGEPKLCGAAADAGLQLVTQATDKKVIVHLYTLALMSHVLLGDYPAAERALQAGEAMAREMHYPNELAMLLVLGGQLQYFVGEDISLAHANLAEAESLRIEMTSQWGSAAFIFGFARLTGLMGDIEKARARFRESEDAAGKVGNMRLVYSCHSELAHILRRHGEIDEALELYKGVLPKWKELGHRSAVAHELECIAFILSQKDRLDQAVTLLGAAQALRELIGSSMTPPERAEYEQALATLREQLGQEEFQQAWKFGQSMSMDQAIIFALDESYA